MLIFQPEIVEELVAGSWLQRLEGKNSLEDIDSHHGPLELM